MDRDPFVAEWPLARARTARQVNCSRPRGMFQEPARGVARRSWTAPNTGVIARAPPSSNVSPRARALSADRSLKVSSSSCPESPDPKFRRGATNRPRALEEMQLAGGEDTSEPKPVPIGH
jgi:hypothetical protein